MSSGGYREGAGRKSGPEGAKVNFACRVLPSTKKKIKDLQQQGVVIGDLIDECVRGYVPPEGK